MGGTILPQDDLTAMEYIQNNLLQYLVRSFTLAANILWFRYFYCCFLVFIFFRKRFILSIFDNEIREIVLGAGESLFFAEESLFVYAYLQLC